MPSRVDGPAAALGFCPSTGAAEAIAGFNTTVAGSTVTSTFLKAGVRDAGST